MTRLFAAAACLGVRVCLAPGGVSAAPPEVGLVPLPQSMPFDGGRLPLAAGSRIVAANPELLPLAGVLSEEVALVAGVRLEVAQGQEKAGDIVLRLGEMPKEVSTSPYASCLPPPLPGPSSEKRTILLCGDSTGISLAKSAKMEIICARGVRVWNQQTPLWAVT